MTFAELAALRSAAAERAQRGSRPTLKDVAADARELSSMLAAEAGGNVHVEFRAGRPVLGQRGPIVRRPLSMDQVEALFLEHWTAAMAEETGGKLLAHGSPLRAALAPVREALLKGTARTRPGARRMSPAHRALFEANVAVVERIAEDAGVSAAQVLSDSRTRLASQARHRACWALYRVRELSYPEVAVVTGRRDHATAISSVRRVDAEVAADPALAERLRRLAA